MRFDRNTATNGSGLHVTTVNAFDALYQPPWLDPLYVAPDILDLYLAIDYSLATTAFRGNTAAAIGGGVLLEANAAAVVIACNFSDNKAAMGGAVASTGSTSATLHRASFSSNEAISAGGAVFAADMSSAAAADCYFVGNTAAYGGALAAFGAAATSLTDVALRSTSATLSGGAGALNSTQPLSLAGAVEASGNRARAGGAICALLRDETNQVLSPCTCSRTEDPFRCCDLF